LSPNGLLDPPRPPADTLGSNNSAGASQDAAPAFKPLNTKSPQAFPSAPTSRPVNPRSSSPFFQNPSAFKAPLVPAQLSAHDDDFSSNKAHIVSSNLPSGFDDRSDISARLPSGSASDQFCLSNVLDSSFGSHCSCTAPRKVTVMSPPAVNNYGNFVDGYGGDSSFSGAFLDEERGQQGHRQGPKHDIYEASERDYKQGPDAKRYKASHLDDFPAPYSGRTTPARYSAHPGFDRTVPPARGVPPPQFHPQHVKATDDEPSTQQTLLRLLGQDLDIFAEAHVDSYEQASRKWAECSAEEWTKGADELMGRFGKMLDFVKDHMTAKIALYATLHNKIADHKVVLADRQQSLKDARENLVREGGAVVGGMPVFAVAGGEKGMEKDD
ncbi:hypothetical protein C8Q78DRAFT_1063279, partial [Trametes maxima]